MKIYQLEYFLYLKNNVKNLYLEMLKINKVMIKKH